MNHPTPEAIEAAGRAFARAYAERDAMTVEEAARAAYVPGGPSVEELAEEIRAQRIRDGLIAPHARSA